MATAPPYNFLEGGGQMGERIRNLDWSETALGPIEFWPSALRSALSICLSAGFPIAIYWGPELTLLYNDAWSVIPGDKHPAALGRPGAEVWPDIWENVGPEFHAVLTEGRSTRSIDTLLPMQRFGYVEETYFDYNLSPIFHADGSIGGVFNAGIETTYRIVNERRNTLLHELLQALRAGHGEAHTWQVSSDVLAGAQADIPFFALLDAGGDLVRSVELRPAEIDFFKTQLALVHNEPLLLSDLPFDIHSFWPERCTEALLVPLLQGGERAGYLVAGISARKRLDEGYRQFLNTIALHIGSALSRNRAEEQEATVRRQLEESEDNLRRLFMQAPMGICILRGEEMIVELVNDPYLAIVQRPREKFEARPVWESLPEVRDQGFDAILQNVLRTGERFIGRDTPVQIIRNGREETIYVDFVYEPLLDANNRHTRIMALVIDVTDKVEARNAIARSEERARLAIDSAELGTFDVNLQTNEIVATPRLAEIMGVAMPVTRPSLVAVLHPDDLHIRDAAYARAFETGYLEYECRIVWNDGSIRWCRFKGSIYFDEAGTARQLLGVVQDITEQKEFAAELTRQVEERTHAVQLANAELERRNSELEQFAYVSSHDLQEPLRKIRMFSDLVREQEWDNLSETGRVRFEKVSAAAERMSRSLRDLLEYAALSRQEQWETVDLNEVVAQVRIDLELLIAQKGAEVEVGQLPQLRAISLQMQQLFYNLVNNALKFARAGVTPHVTISCTTFGSHYEIRVRDNGIGFSPEHAHKIFTIFQRLHDRQSYGGSGIGLALCKKVVENHGGAIRAEGRPGEGAEFVVTLPR